MQIPKTITAWAQAVGIILMFGGSAAASAGENETVRNAVDDIVRSYREIIVLSMAEDDPDAQQADRASVVGKIIYHENIRRLNRLQTSIQDNDSALEGLLEILEKDESLWDADKLAFMGLMEDALEYFAADAGLRQPGWQRWGRFYL
jgi:hypothetical protein